MTGLASAKDYMVMKQAGDYTVNMKMDKNPPVSGNNRMGISILDKAEAYVTDDIMTLRQSRDNQTFFITHEIGI